MTNKIFNTIKSDKQLKWIIFVISVWIIICIISIFNEVNNINGYKFKNLKADSTGTYYKNNYYIKETIKNKNGECKRKMTEYVEIQQNNSSILRNYYIDIYDLPSKGSEMDFTSKKPIEIHFDNFSISIDHIFCED